MTGDDVATAMESVARAMRFRASVEPAEAVQALALVLGVTLAASAPEAAPQRRVDAAPGVRSEAAARAGKASALVRKAIFGSAQPRTSPERPPERPPNEVTERPSNDLRTDFGSVEGGYGGSASGSDHLKAGEEAEDPEYSEATDQVDQGEPETPNARTSPERPSNGLAERPPERPPNIVSASTVELVFDAWRLEVGSQRAKLDRKRTSRIRSRLAEGFTADELIRAIRNRRNDPFLMGRNDTGRVYDGIETLLRDAAQVERLMVLTAPAKSNPVNGGRTRAGDLLPRQLERIREQEEIEARELAEALS